MEKRRNRFNKIIPYWILPIKKLYHSKKVKTWCGLSYPGHPKGCPNYLTDKEDCPNNSPYISDILDLTKPMFLVFSEFNLKQHILNMKRKHPDWTDKQCKNVLYWQRISKKQMIDRAMRACKLTNSNKIITKGESYGVNLYITCKKAGLHLEKIKNIKTCHYVAILGHLKRKDK